MREGNAVGEGTCCGPAASTGTTTREGSGGNTRIQNIVAKAVEHSKTPTTDAEGGTCHEEGALLICGLASRGGLGHGQSGGVG